MCCEEKGKSNVYVYVNLDVDRFSRQYLLMFTFYDEDIARRRCSASLLGVFFDSNLEFPSNSWLMNDLLASCQTKSLIGVMGNKDFILVPSDSI